MNPGSIVEDLDFEFHDGTSGKKILIILNDGTCGFYIVVKTTSQPDRRSTSSGCNLTDPYPNFFVPLKDKIFRKQTWICLNEFYEFTGTELLRRKFDGNVTYKGNLGKPVTKALIRCAARADDISLAHEKHLRNTIATHFP